MRFPVTSIGPPGRWTCFALCALAAIWLGFSSIAAPADKVDPRVWEDTANGRTAPFLVLLSTQTNTFAIARDKPDRKSRHRAVVDALRQHAGRSQDALRAQLNAQATRHRPYWIVNMLAVDGSRALVESLAAREDVRAIESDRAFRVPLEQPQKIAAAPVIASGSLITSVEANLVKIRAPDVWARGFTGQGIVYANADTGVQWDHPALKPHYRGWDGTNVNHNYNWWDAIHADIDGDGVNSCGFNNTVPCDDDGHGTHTTGIGVGSDGANNIGVAPGAKWIACRNMDEGTGRPSTYIECMQFFLAPTDLAGDNPDPDKAPDCVGNSYGCPLGDLGEKCEAQSLHAALQSLRDAGIFMAVSAGNSGPGCGSIKDPPALDAASITVGATDLNDTIASFSSRGPVIVDGSNRPKPELVAPGVSVRSSYRGNVFRNLSGTSMSSPHVAGAVALLWSAYPSLRGQVDNTLAVLEQSAVPLTSAQLCGGDTNNAVPNNVFGYGRIDVFQAFLRLGQLPIASNLKVVLKGDSTTNFSLVATGPEGATLTFQITTLPTNGLLSGFNPSTGTLNYTPAHAYSGPDSFTFTASDGLTNSGPATVSISVSALIDSDHDSIPNYWEIQNNLILDPFDASDANADPDHDGVSNLNEYLANTNPGASNSVFRIVAITQNLPGHAVITWASVGAVRYRVQYCNGMTGEAFNFLDLARPANLEIDPATPEAASTMTFTDDFTLTGRPQPGVTRFYRIRLVR
jgi:subtilisin family serine protease